MKTEKEKIDFMFHVIQYVERQVVLYDSAEDAAFEQLVQLDDHLSLKDCITLLAGNEKTCSLSDDLSCFSARLVFTAHPNPVLLSFGIGYHRQLKSMITRNDINQIDLTTAATGIDLPDQCPETDPL
jgi:phosphoenolpyruvate carboxylase